MKTVKLNCASCGAPLTITENAETIICPSCNSTLSIDRGEGGVTLKVIEKLTESIHEMGAMTSSALKESAFVTQVELKRMQLNQLISMEEMKINSLQAEIRATKRRLQPGPVLNTELGDLLLQENDIRMHIRSLQADIAHLESGWQDSLEVIQQDLQILKSAISVLSPYAHIVPVSNRLNQLQQEVEKVKASYDRLESRLLRKEIASDKYPSFANLNLEEMEALQEKIPADLQLLRSKEQTQVNQSIQAVLREKLDKIKAHYPRKKIESETGKLTALDLKGPYPEAPEALNTLIDQVNADLMKVSELSNSHAKDQISKILMFNRDTLAARAAENIPAKIAKKKKTRLVLLLSGGGVVFLCLAVILIFGISAGLGSRTKNEKTDLADESQSRITDNRNLSSVQPEKAEGYEEYVGIFHQVTASTTYLRESPAYDASGTFQVRQGDILRNEYEASLPEGWYKVSTLDGTTMGYLAQDWISTITVLSVPGESVTTTYGSEVYHFTFDQADEVWENTSFDDAFAKGTCACESGEYQIEIAANDTDIYYYVNQTIPNLPDNYLYSLTFDQVKHTGWTFYGLQTNAIDGENFDALLINPEGSLILVAVRNGEFFPLYDTTISANSTVGVDPEGKNSFTMIRQKDTNESHGQYDYAINGQIFATMIVDQMGSPIPDMGLLLYLNEKGDSATVRVDDFVILQ